MAFDGDGKIGICQHLGYGPQGLIRLSLQTRLPRREQHAIVDFDGHPPTGFKQAHLALRHQGLQRAHDVTRDIAHFFPLHPASSLFRPVFRRRIRFHDWLG